MDVFTKCRNSCYAGLVTLGILNAQTVLGAPVVQCEVEYDIQSQWQWGFVAEINLKNNGPEPIEGYTLSWELTEGGKFHSGWNAKYQQSDNTITASNTPENWNGIIPANGRSIEFGFLGQNSGFIGENPQFELNGVRCNDTKAPSSIFTFWPQTAVAFEEVRFYGLASNDTQNDIVNYHWDFGDGNLASGVNATHAYTSTGNHTVTLSVTDAAGNTDTHSQTIAIPLGSAGPVDLANMTWEDGTTEGWSSESSSVSNSTERAFSGDHSLRWDVNTDTAEFLTISTDIAGLAPPGSKVIYRIWVPADAPITWIQPFLMPHSPDWLISRWHGEWRSGDNLKANEWNEFSLTLDSDIDTEYLQYVGVQLQTSAPSNFTLYIDAVDWEEGSTPPKASFDYSPNLPTSNQTVTFDAVSAVNNNLRASSRNSTIVSYEWDFGDGHQASGKTFTHAYTKPGKYNSILKVIDSEGLSHSLTRTIWVEQNKTSFAPPLNVNGSNIVDNNGNVVVPKGVALIDTITWHQADFEYLKKEYKINMLRLILIPERWYYVDAASREAYLNQVDHILMWTRDLGIYVSFDGWHEGGVGNEIDEWAAIQDGWNILAARYASQDHIIWETFNEPHHTTWLEWADMAEAIIDIISSYNPVVDVFGVPGVVWAQNLDVRSRQINRQNVIYLMHPYPHVYDAEWTPEVWDNAFGYVALEGYGPVLNTEWSYPLFDKGDTSYGEALLSYQLDRGFGHLHWIYGGWTGPSPSNPNALRDDAWQLIWEQFNGLK